MKTYRISRHTKITIAVVIGVAVIGFYFLIYLMDASLAKSDSWLWVNGLLFLAIQGAYFISNSTEHIILTAEIVTYNRLFSRKSVNWRDVTEIYFLDTWTAQPMLVIEYPDNKLEIDYSSFDNPKQFIADVRSHAPHITFKNKYEFTEV